MPRDTLTRDQIVEAAVAVLDADGITGLNMRRLGAQLGMAATAMYWHVRSKDDLVVLAGDHAWSQIELPDLATTGWREATTVLARGAYEMVSRHFWLVPAMSTHLVYGPGKARYDDCCLAAYESAGFTVAEANQAAATVLMFVLGAAQAEGSEQALRAHARRGGGEEALRIAIARAEEVAGRYPRLTTHSTSAAGMASPFEFGLATILDGLASRSARSRPAARGE
ncbi:TetR/AcrR family transcriptional regulator [Fodinicola acaciae]|uniref:TetR/AcrR family transcriptional regulator n=1 Tax=Fodinicola acaciae TaxID=2681555 RepID=UPI0013D38487|nr:TetR/AcrR family transcriptional regulator [Fodinicola acaciae]